MIKERNEALAGYLCQRDGLSGPKRSMNRAIDSDSTGTTNSFSGK